MEVINNLLTEELQELIATGDISPRDALAIAPPDDPEVTRLVLEALDSLEATTTRGGAVSGAAAVPRKAVSADDDPLSAVLPAAMRRAPVDTPPDTLLSDDLRQLVEAGALTLDQALEMNETETGQQQQQQQQPSPLPISPRPLATTTYGASLPRQQPTPLPSPSSSSSSAPTAPVTPSLGREASVDSMLGDLMAMLTNDLRAMVKAGAIDLGEALEIAVHMGAVDGNALKTAAASGSPPQDELSSPAPVAAAVVAVSVSAQTLGTATAGSPSHGTPTDPPPPPPSYASLSRVSSEEAANNSVVFPQHWTAQSDDGGHRSALSWWFAGRCAVDIAAEPGYGGSGGRLVSVRHNNLYIVDDSNSR